MEFIESGLPITASPQLSTHRDPLFASSGGDAELRNHLEEANGGGKTPRDDCAQEGDSRVETGMEAMRKVGRRGAAFRVPIAHDRVMALVVESVTPASREEEVAQRFVSDLSGEAAAVPCDGWYEGSGNFAR